MADQIAIIGMCRADPAVPWPTRGSGGRELTEPRPGWSARQIPATRCGESVVIDALCFGDLAVNVMLEDEGFAICLAATGFRISYSGAVFATCDAAMQCVEAMSAGDEYWSSIPLSGFTARQRRLLGELIENAERRGDILLDRVYPT